MTNGSFKEGRKYFESIAESNTFDLDLLIIDLENQFVVLLRVAVLHRLYCTLVLAVTYLHSVRVGIRHLHCSLRLSDHARIQKVFSEGV